mgnify:CR=1 FL=1
MKKYLLITLCAVVGLTGCASLNETYKAQPWTPDGFNYTLARDRDTGSLCDYWGLSWSLK